MLTTVNQPSQTERAIAGDAEAVRALWETNRRWIAAVVLAHMPRSPGGGEPDVEDLLQEVAVRMVRTVHTLRDPATIKPWLRTIAVNVARTAGRRRVPRLRLIRAESASAEPLAEVEAGERAAGATGLAGAQTGSNSLEEGKRVMAAAQRLSPEYREPLLLRCVRGMSYKQIADVLGAPVTTIETRLARARRMIREELGEISGQDAAKNGGANAADA